MRAAHAVPDDPARHFIAEQGENRRSGYNFARGEAKILLFYSALRNHLEASREQNNRTDNREAFCQEQGENRGMTEAE